MIYQRAVRKWHGLGWFGTTSALIWIVWHRSVGIVKYSYRPPLISIVVSVTTMPTTIPIVSATTVLCMGRV